MVGRSYVKALSKKCENSAWIEKKSCVEELYETTDFWLQKFLWLQSFFNHFFQKWWIKKWPEPKKLLKPKITFFMPVDLPKEFSKFVDNQTLF